MGPPGGYDHLCGECEDGVTVYQLALASARDYLTRCRGWDFTHAIILHGLINRLGESPDHAATVDTALRGNTPPWFTPLGRRCFHVDPDGVTAVRLL